jgi:hypothetical protein
MKRLILFTALLLAIFFLLPLVAEQMESNDLETNVAEPNIIGTGKPTAEMRLLALEKRVDVLEQRVNQLERPRAKQSAVELPADPDKDKLRKDRLNKQIQEARDAIEIAEAEIDSLPGVPSLVDVPIRYWLSWLDDPHNRRRVQKMLEDRDCDDFEDMLEIVKRKRKLLSGEEDNYLRIARYAEKNPDLGIDVVNAKRDVARCQNSKKETDLLMERVQQLVWDCNRKGGTEKYKGHSEKVHSY